MKKIFTDSFETHIRNILKVDTSQPIMKLDKTTDVKPQDALELLMQATQNLREQYFTRHDKARQEIQKRVKILHLLKEQQKKEIQDLTDEKESMRDKAEKLAEMYDDIYEKQQTLLKRAQDIVRLSTLRLPQSSSMEKEYLNSLEKVKTKTQILIKNLEQAKVRLTTQQQMMEKSNKTMGDKVVNLPTNKETVIKDVLTEV